MGGMLRLGMAIFQMKGGVAALGKTPLRSIDEKTLFGGIYVFDRQAFHPQMFPDIIRYDKVGVAKLPYGIRCPRDFGGIFQSIAGSCISAVKSCYRRSTRE
jgi:hypothetical protein